MEYSQVCHHIDFDHAYSDLFRHHLAPLIAVGSDDCNTSTGAKLQLWEYAADR